MSLAVLTDDQIKVLLENLTLEEFEGFRDGLKSALHEYSNGTQAIDDGAIHQPHRTSVQNRGATTLFMPSASPVGHGVKVLTLSNKQPAGPGDGDDPGVIRPTGAITLFNPDGTPAGILHASTLTAFRTALASVCLVYKRNTVRTLTVFGAGEQAYWHIRLTLLLRGSTIRQVNIINRRFSPSCKAILKRLYNVPLALKEREGWAECTFGILTPGYGEFNRLLDDQILAADIIFCCTPSQQPLFNAGTLTSHEGRRKGRLIVAIGSYTPEMRELPIELLKQATKPHEKGHMHFHKHAPEGGVIVVDTLDGALKEAGEIIEAGLEPKQLVELGELVMLHRIRMAEAEDSSDTGSNISIPSADFEKLDLSSTGSGSAMSSVFAGGKSSSRSSSPSRRSFSFHRRSSSHGSVDAKKKKDDHLARWLQGGNVIYKSVGLGLMDLTVGMHLIKVAKEKQLGIHVEGF
ncbi:NAD(P)-binding protein [Thozetella sp. PMI_491]|nr:NAD(P)-binding protein [Thozetella sp. PMI_491]